MLLVFVHVGVGRQRGGIGNVCDLAHIWSYTLREGEERYISTQRTLSSRSTQR